MEFSIANQGWIGFYSTVQPLFTGPLWGKEIGPVNGGAGLINIIVNYIKLNINPVFGGRDKSPVKGRAR